MTYIYHIDENPAGFTSKLAADLKWTTEPPTVEGLYSVYHRNRDGSKSWPSWHELTRSGDHLVIDIYDDDQEILSVYINKANKNGYRVYWLGPLPVPEPPTEEK